MLDPSYEVKTEYQQVVQLIQQAHKKFSTGIYALWYPIVKREQVVSLLRDIKKTHIPNILSSEWCVAPDSDEYGMTGSGMVVINPPYTLWETVSKTQRVLQKALELHAVDLTWIRR